MKKVLQKRNFGIVGLFPLASKMLLLCLAAGSAAHAVEIFLEAEQSGVQDGGRATKITSPLLIKDDNLASDGSYIEVLAGKNSNGSMPAAEGVVSLVFDQPNASSQFTIWARVIAPSTADDSFWLKMDGGSPINWNNIPLGTAWHWVQIKAEGAASAAKFTLSQGTHTLRIAYREDGTKLDQLIITNNANFNPNATVTGAPRAPKLTDNYRAATEVGNLLSWSEVPGASSYRLVQVTGTGETVLYNGKGHTRVVPAGFNSFYVLAITPNGANTASETVNQISRDRFFDAYRNPAYTMSVTAPMVADASGFGEIFISSGTVSSPNAVPAQGRARYDFRVAVTTDISVFAEVDVPNTSSDSYWVRMDQGPWVKWNNIPNFTCSPVRNSDAGGAIQNYHLNPGSHTLEFAYREVGTSLVRFGLTPYTEFASPCED